MNIKEYFARISYKGPQECLDLETLTAILQHHIRSVPFEGLSIHCGESIKLDLEPIYDKIVKQNRGGWCMENNHLLFWVFQTMGYDISLLGAYVFNPLQDTYGKDMNHLLLKVVMDDKVYIVDGGFGIAYQIWQPMELVSGKDQPQAPGIFRFTEDNGVWYFDKLKRKQHIIDADNPCSDSPKDMTCKKVFSFTLQPQTIDEFRLINKYLQTASDSLFVNKSICSLQTTSGFQVLIGWTFTEVTYNYKDNIDLVKITTLTDEEVDKMLQERFNIRLDKKLVPINTRLTPVLF
ncbi:arylamine N-acetyltransferase, pineal gland isozyme NAT-3-like [Rhineura floridana]|uniref:arylamine N-acetyltransferase, pineal gland isozyme NAT-3-like n=1 Tax=Rhineura floridana TaxID=261503 RepID=UPI002AC84DE7|nr:arylamine N-acetyltransferase, pineal gland isozyme NAT-3-like [Rhineura floridana]